MWPFRKREEQRAITSIDGYWPDNSNPNMAMAHVSISRALALAPVFSAVSLIANSVASLTPVLYKKGPDGVAKRQPTPLLFQNPSIHGTLYDWLYRGVASQASSGDAIGLVTNRDRYGFPTMIEWLNPEQVATQDGKLYGPGSYMKPIWWWYGRPIDPSNLVHIPWFVMPYKVRGLSPIGAFQMTANIGISAQEFAMNWFGTGGVPPGTFKNTMRTIDPDDATKVSDGITNRIRSRKPLVYGNDWEYSPIAIKPHEAEFVTTMQLTANHIASIYHVPPEKIGGSTGTNLTYNTVEQNTMDYLLFSVDPWLVRWEYALTNLFPRGLYVKFDRSELMRVDALTQAKIDQMSLGFQPPGWRAVDEVRATHDLPPMPKQPQIPMQPQQLPMQPMRFRQNDPGTPQGQIANNSNVLSGTTPAPPKGGM